MLQNYFTTNYFLLNNLKIKTNSYNLKIKFSLFFISLVPPFFLNNLRFISNLKNINKNCLIKQSYILLTWFYYITFFNSDNINSKNRIKIAVLPTVKKIFTLTKAPMAHKNWSKEQYKYQYFKFKVTFKSVLTTETNVVCLNSSLLFIFLAKKMLFSFETNLFFLKYFNFFFLFSDKIYFNYWHFLN